MVKAVVFDLGKVLVDFNWAIAVRKVAARCTVSLSEIAGFVGATSLVLDYETGLMSSQEFYQRICQATGYCGSFEEFGLAFSDMFTPIEPMIRLQAHLRERGFPTFIFSNTNDLAVRHIRKHYPFFANFDGYILSYEHGAMKPDAKLYEVVERQSGYRGADILYLDDRPENIATGAARGWQVIVQESPEKTFAALRQLGLLDRPL